MTDYLTARNASSLSSLESLNNGLQDGFNLPRVKNNIVQHCTLPSACGAGTICDLGVCKVKCVVGNAKCAGGQPCQARSKVGVNVGSQALLTGVCPVSNSKVTTKTSPGPLVQ